MLTRSLVILLLVNHKLVHMWLFVVVEVAVVNRMLVCFARQLCNSVYFGAKMRCQSAIIHKHLVREISTRDFFFLSWFSLVFCSF